MEVRPRESRYLRRCDQIATAEEGAIGDAAVKEGGDGAVISFLESGTSVEPWRRIGALGNALYMNHRKTSGFTKILPESHRIGPRLPSGAFHEPRRAPRAFENYGFNYYGNGLEWSLSLYESFSTVSSNRREFFNSMVNNYHILPQEKHYSCMVDLLAHGGEIDEACSLLHNTRMKPNASVWGAILGACSVHGDVTIGKVAARHLFDLDPWKSVNHVVLAGIYATAGLWDGAWDTRKLMKVENLQKKQSGCSFFQSTSKRLLLPGY
ncbi:hypothetical protein R6Q57_009203 [Mikania cordata]